ncbi:MAG: DNRLRE domain-containing protein, partial [Verrucomicrobia bacterium]|nr:DNRLRE domain-containing protein [Verrucomicrobiota bacterium]
MNRVRLTGVVALASALAFAPLCQAAQITLQHGANNYAGTTDTWMDYSNESATHGSDTNMLVYLSSWNPRRSSLVKFDLSGAMSAGATVNSASLGLWFIVEEDMTGGDFINIGAHRVRSGRDWSEGQACWWYYKATTPWTAYGCESEVSDRFSWESWLQITNNTPAQWFSWNVTGSVQAWNGGTENNGWLMRGVGHDGGTDGAWFATRDGAQALRPKLTINYTGSLTWTGSSDTNWNTSTTNWKPTGGNNYATSFGDGDTVVFDDTGANRIIHIPSAVSPGAMIVSNSVAAPYLFNGVISGSGGLTKYGHGLATLGTNNSYTGATIINAGTLALLSTGALGNTTSTVLLGATSGTNEASLALGKALTLNRNIQVRSGSSGPATLGATNTSGTATLAGSVALQKDVTLSAAAGGTLDVTGAISDNANEGITKTGDGVVQLSGANTYRGPTTVNASALRLGANNVLSDNTLTVNSATLDLNNFSDTIGALNLHTGAVSGTGALTLGGDVTARGASSVAAGTLQLNGARGFNVVGAGDTLAVNAIVSGAGSSLTKSGAGTLTLANAANDYSGGTVFNAGLLRIGADEHLGNGSVTFNGGALQFTGVAAATSTRAVLLNAAGGTINITNSSSLTLAGPISGDGALTKTGAGTIGLDNAANSYNGGTLLNAGTVRVGADSHLGNGSVTFNGGTLQVTGTVVMSSAKALTLNSAATIEVLNSGGVALAGDIGGAGSFTKTGAGTLTLAGNNNDYNGGTVLAAGTTRLDGGDNRLPSSTFLSVYPSATLDLNGFNQTVGGLGGAGAITNSGPGTPNLTVNDGGIAGVFPGTLGGNLSLTKAGAGSLSVGGANAHTGGTRIEDGTLRMLPGGTLGSGALTLTGGGLQLNGNNLTIAGLNGAAGYIENSSLLAKAGLTVNETGSDSYAGTLRDGLASLPLSFTKTGPGTLTLGADSTFTGSAIISEGTLVANANDALGLGTVSIKGGTLRIGGGVVFDNPIVFTSGALGGEGTFLQPVTVPNGGILTPGNSPGTLHGVDLTLEN